MTEVFKLIQILKGVKNAELILNEDDEYFIKYSYPRLKKILSFKLYKKLVIEYSINVVCDIYDAADIVSDAIYKKYKK